MRRTLVLVTVERNGDVKLYAERGVNVLLVHRVAYEHDGAWELEEEYFESSLPRGWEHLVEPRNLRAEGNPRWCLTAEQELLRLSELKAIRELSKLKDSLEREDGEEA